MKYFFFGEERAFLTMMLIVNTLTGGLFWAVGVPPLIQFGVILTAAFGLASSYVHSRMFEGIATDMHNRAFYRQEVRR